MFKKIIQLIFLTILIQTNHAIADSNNWRNIAASEVDNKKVIVQAKNKYWKVQFFKRDSHNKNSQEYQLEFETKNQKFINTSDDFIKNPRVNIFYNKPLKTYLFAYDTKEQVGSEVGLYTIPQYSVYGIIVPIELEGKHYHYRMSTSELRNTFIIATYQSFVKEESMLKIEAFMKESFKQYPNLKFKSRADWYGDYADKYKLSEFKKLYYATAQTYYNSPQYYKAYHQLRRFVKRTELSQLDPQNQTPLSMVWLTDYAYWSLKNGDPNEAFRSLSLNAERPTHHDTFFLILGDAAFESANKEQEYRDIKMNIGQEAYKQYCYRKLTQQTSIKADTEIKIKNALGVDKLTLQTCLPINNLLQAITEEDLTKIKELVSIGGDLNVGSYYPASQYQNSHINPPIYLAISKNNYDIVELLLKNGADATHVYGSGNGTNGVFIYAFNQFLKSNYPINNYSLLDTKMLDLLLQYGGDINAPYINESYLLQYAIDENVHGSILKYLLERGADPNFKTTLNNESPLITAATEWQLDTVKLLVELGKADINHSITRSSANGKYICRPPIYYIISQINAHKEETTQLDMLKYFILQGADVTSGGILNNRSCDGDGGNGWEQDLKRATERSKSKTAQCYIYQSLKEDKIEKRVALLQKCDEAKL